MARSTGKSPATQQTASRPESGDRAPNPVWFKPIMFGFMLLGLVWIIVFYLSNSTYPVPGIGAWNIAIGFGIMFVGFLMTTRWR